MAKQYGSAENYEAKLERVMARLGVESFDYDWSRFECWVEFTYKGGRYRFSHSLENARAHGVEFRYGSDAFAQVVLALEDLARIVERGIYELSTWVSGMKMLPAAQEIEPCFQALGFAERPTEASQVKEQYRRMAKALHPDTGGNEAAFTVLRENFERCIQILEIENDG